MEENPTKTGQQIEKEKTALDIQHTGKSFIKKKKKVLRILFQQELFVQWGKFNKIELYKFYENK